jgi:hypothetical protein
MRMRSNDTHVSITQCYLQVSMLAVKMYEIAVNIHLGAMG